MKTLFIIGKSIGGLVFLAGLISMLLDFWHDKPWFMKAKKTLWYIVVGGFVSMLLVGATILILVILSKI